MGDTGEDAEEAKLEVPRTRATVSFRSLVSMSARMKRRPPELMNSMRIARPRPEPAPVMRITELEEWDC